MCLIPATSKAAGDRLGEGRNHITPVAGDVDRFQEGIIMSFHDLGLAWVTKSDC
jgi:hypothetical protein